MFFFFVFLGGVITVSSGMVLFSIKVKSSITKWPFQLAFEYARDNFWTAMAMETSFFAKKNGMKQVHQAPQRFLGIHHWKKKQSIILAVFFIFNEQLESCLPPLFIIFASCAGQRIPRVFEEGSAALGYAYLSGIAWAQVMAGFPHKCRWMVELVHFVLGSTDYESIWI